MISLSAEPLLPYLFEIIENPESEGVILAGGLGLRVKRAYLDSIQAQTLFEEAPDLRATSDIDIFLLVHFWIEEARASRFAQLLAKLDYRPKSEYWQFEKAFKDVKHKQAALDLPSIEENPDAIGAGSALVVDLLSRLPVKGERVKVKRDRVGEGRKTGLHGRTTPEAFAIEDRTLTVQIQHQDRMAEVRLAHPYGFLNLKTSAAWDWLREIRGEIPPKSDEETGERLRLKHVFDVYAIVGMLTEDELEQAEALAGKYSDHPEAQRIRAAALDLYGTRESPGSAVILSHEGGAWRDHYGENYLAFWNALSRALGI